jgi:hypothetical protein
MGLASLVAMGLYLLISIGVVAWTVRRVRKSGRSTLRWGIGALVVLYMIPFWDWIPTFLAHEFHCARETGFWAYKTSTQWKTENPGMVERLVAKTPARPTRIGDMENFVDTYFLNQRINWKIQKSGPLLINVWRWQQEIVDNKTNEILARSVDFSTGNGNIGGEPPLRFWLQRAGCTGKSAISNPDFDAFKQHFLGKQG